MVRADESNRIKVIIDSVSALSPGQIAGIAIDNEQDKVEYYLAQLQQYPNITVVDHGVVEKGEAVFYFIRITRKNQGMA